MKEAFSSVLPFLQFSTIIIIIITTTFLHLAGCTKNYKFKGLIFVFFRNLIFFNSLNIPPPPLECTFQVPTNKLTNLTAIPIGPNSVVIQWAYDCEQQRIALHENNGTITFKVELCPVTTTSSTCDRQRAITRETLKSRLLFDELQPDTRYLVRIYAPTIQPNINICVRTRVGAGSGAEDNAAEKKWSWAKVVSAVIGAVVGVAVLLGLLYYAVQQLRLLQSRRSSLTINVLSDVENSDCRPDFGREQEHEKRGLPYKGAVLAVDGQVVLPSLVELSPGSLAVTSEQKVKPGPFTTTTTTFQSSYVSLPPPVMKNV